MSVYSFILSIHVIAGVYLFQGRNDEALTEWRIAFENGWSGTPGGESHEWWFIEAPFEKFDSVRDDPRFLALRDDMRAELDRQRRALERDGLAIAEQGTGMVRKSTESLDAGGSGGQQLGRRLRKSLKRRPRHLRS